MRLLMLDNYDSFTYNLVQLIKDNSTLTVDVFRNDEISLHEVNNYDKIVLSPGPGLPNESGILCDLIKTYQNSKSIFGVCLGMQAIGEVFGGTLINLKEPLHGISTPVKHTDSFLFKGIPATFNVGRYHSWAVDANTLPEDIIVTAEDENGFVMAIEHRQLNISGVQFHPESILTDYGKIIMTNFLNDLS
ncbi:MAG: aminodeoxychorismate/anthranilate synthase component II [Bacteroidetes bacterium]|nr:aminodeoxychorismate/anthranilate synthase component II [Bacteroidota bacterium]